MTIREKLKVYELAKEFSVDPQSLLETLSRLGIEVKNSMSLLGSEEVRTVRDHYRKNKGPQAKTTVAAPPTTKPVTEKRVGSNVIRRRAKTEAEPEPEPEVEVQEQVVTSPAPESEEIPVVEASEPVTETIEEPIESVAPSEVPPQVIVEAKQPPAPVEPKPPTPVVMVDPPKPRRFYPSIIKKITTEAHLGAVVGPKVEKKEKPPADKTARPATGVATDASATALGGPKRIKEVELATEAAKEAAKRKLTEGQTVTFKRADYLKRELVHATKKKKAVMSRPIMKTLITTPAEHKRVVEMQHDITVSELAKEMGIKSSQLVGKLMGMGVTATLNQKIDFDTASLVAHEFSFEVKQKIFREEDFLTPVDLSPEAVSPRFPVVTIMGHVDHGKTSLLDAIRKTNVAAGEAGGITQHIGAYRVEVPGKGKVTFIDTPGHEAFTAMRARGAKVTDIVILVVSAIDGVMPQTLESIAHAKAAGVPIIVAVNKTDLPDANPDRIKQTLAGHELAPEEWGGQTIYVNVSAKTGKGIPELLENILLQSEMLELKANFSVAARGTVVESRLDKSRGPLATVLIQHGTLQTGDILVCGVTSGKVKAMNDSYGRRLTEAGPGEPVEVLGLSDVPTVGDESVVVENDSDAQELTKKRAEIVKAKQNDSRPKLTLDSLMAEGQADGQKELRAILKADVQGSAEAIREAVLKLPSTKAKLKVLHTATGGVTEGDVMLAEASQAVILGFNIRPDLKALKLAEASHVDVRTYNIIYDLLDDVKNLLEGLLDKVVKEKVIGRAEVRDVFNIPKIGTIAGSAVLDGKVSRGCFLRLLRDNRVVYEGKLASLKRFKEDVKEVASGYECGIGLENFNDVKTGDHFEAFIKEESQGTLV